MRGRRRCARQMQHGTAASAQRFPGTTAFAEVVGRANADIHVVNTSGTGLRPLAEIPGWKEVPDGPPHGSSSLVSPAVVSDPPRRVASAGIVMGPMNQPTLLVPLVLALERDHVTHPQGIDSGSYIHVMGEQ
jgi:hypothetical protein